MSSSRSADVHRPEPALSPAAARVLRQLVLHGDATRTALAHDTGLTAGAITRAVRPLLEAGLLDETGERVPAEGAPGRPATTVTLRARAHQVVGVKLTADRLFGVVADLRCGVLDEASVPVDGPRPSSSASRSWSRACVPGAPRWAASGWRRRATSTPATSPTPRSSAGGTCPCATRWPRAPGCPPRWRTTCARCSPASAGTASG